jgi:outer membrane protein OmpA-like peptidoglycan-associated protein
MRFESASARRARVAIWVIPIVDLLLICAGVAFARAWLLERAVRPVVGRLETDLVADLDRIRGADVAPAVARVRARAQGLVARVGELGRSSPVLAAYTRELVARELGYWREQARSLRRPCVDPDALPRPPALQQTTRLGAELLDLARVQRYGAEIARRLKDCTATIPVPITDDDLTFRFGSARELEMTEDEQREALDHIKSEVDAHPDHRWIYVAGHADYLGGPRVNYPLSEGRAAFVAAIIREHLDGQRLIEGKDYRIFVERRGDAECPRRGDADDPSYRKTCRKIVLRFQRGLAEAGAAQKPEGADEP